MLGETELKNLADRALALSQAEQTEVVIFAPHGSLRSMADKIDMAYAVGLLQPSLLKSLRMMRKVRNDFAHDVDATSFSDESIANRLRELFEAEKQYMAVAWKTLKREGAVLREDDDPTVVQDARRFIERAGARTAFELYVCHVVATFEESVAGRDIERLEALPEVRTY